EQVMDAAPVVADLLAAAAGLTILVTSRERLHLYGEYEYAVPPLTLAGAPSVESVQDSEAGRLFAARARAARPDFAISPANAPAVSAICRQLDGLPLAIELAAAQVRTLEPAAMLAPLQQRLSFLTGGPRDASGRQQTRRGAIGWSYDLLDPGQRAVFRRLAVFVGGFTGAAAAAVVGAETAAGPLAEQLPALEDKSLLWSMTGVGGDRRFAMLETIREYAWEQLGAEGEVALYRDRHTAYYEQLALEAKGALAGPEQGAWLERLAEEHDNLRAALAAALEQEAPDTALQMGAALWKFWLLHGHLSEGQAWLDAAVTQDTGGPRPLRAAALNGLGNLAASSGDYATATRVYEAALAVRRAVGDHQGVASSLNNLALVAHAQGDLPHTMALHEQSLAIKRELNDAWGIASSLGNMGIVAQDQGAYEEARRLHAESLAIRRSLGDTQGIANSLNSLGVTLLALGDAAGAWALHQESLALKRELGDRAGSALSLLNLGETQRFDGHYAEAVPLYAEALALCRELGDPATESTALHNLGHAHLRLGAIEVAAACFAESLRIRQELGDRRGISECLAALAEVRTTRGQAARAAQLFGAATALMEQVGFRLHPVDQAEYDRHLALARAQLDPDAWRKAWAAGAAATLDGAVAFALNE
ncbi:MAG TPA: tetratricopeptide repeat protein, partial [Chloroflexia bacterium]|nr:tetratricopeptide repeat protein [Chloroflexia bacterium]